MEKFNQDAKRAEVICWVIIILGIITMIFGSSIMSLIGFITAVLSGIVLYSINKANKLNRKEEKDGESR